MLMNSKLVEIKTNSAYLVWYLDKVVRPFILIMPKLSGYLRHFKLKMEIKIKTINWSLSDRLWKAIRKI